MNQSTALGHAERDLLVARGQRCARTVARGRARAHLRCARRACGSSSPCGAVLAISIDDGPCQERACTRAQPWDMQNVTYSSRARLGALAQSRADVRARA